MSVWALGISLAVTAYGAAKQHDAAKKAEGIDKANANYNARIDETMAQQLDLDTQANIRTQREEDAAYLSRQDASYAAAGVLSNTGSAMDAQIYNAGRMEQRIQQQWINANQQEQKYYSAASVGRLEGDARASSDRAMASLALINGGVKIAGMASNAYDKGAFKFGKDGGGTSTEGMDWDTKG